MKLISTFNKIVLTSVIVSLSVTSTAMAKGKKPKPSFAADPKIVIKTFNGKTWMWSKGGSYWGAGGKFEAVWDESVGLGKWYVTTKGTLCYEAVWYGPGESDDVIKRCWDHVTDEDGFLWQQSTKKADIKKWGWYVFVPSKKLEKGNKIKSQANKLKRANGI